MPAKASAPYRYGRSRSLVRKLSYFLPFCAAPRIFFNIVIKPNNTRDFEHPDYDKKIYAHEVDSSPRRPSWKVKPDLLEFGTRCKSGSYDDKANVTEKLTSLELELKDLREQMARIMVAQIHSGKADESQRSNSVSGPPCAPPPPPPPPPLPPPVFSLNVPPRVSRTSNTKTPKLLEKRAIDMTDVLKDLGKVKLRQVARSPGGTPLRQAPKQTDPNVVLLQVLKKRYAAMHDLNPSDKIDECAESDTSFSSVFSN